MRALKAGEPPTRARHPAPTSFTHVKALSPALIDPDFGHIMAVSTLRENVEVWGAAPSRPVPTFGTLLPHARETVRLPAGRWTRRGRRADMCLRPYRCRLTRVAAAQGGCRPRRSSHFVAPDGARNDSTVIKCLAENLLPSPRWRGGGRGVFGQGLRNTGFD